jgi:hypothetical protein
LNQLSLNGISRLVSAGMSYVKSGIIHLENNCLTRGRVPKAPQKLETKVPYAFELYYCTQSWVQHKRGTEQNKSAAAMRQQLEVYLPTFAPIPCPICFQPT